MDLRILRLAMIEKNQEIPILVSQSNFSIKKAAKEAFSRACDKFGLTDSGNLENIKDSCRSSDRIIIVWQDFSINGGMNGVEYVHSFIAKVTMESVV